jgi:hypothetical protein
MQEGRSAGPIVIKDVAAGAFEYLLHYIYTDRLPEEEFKGEAEGGGGRGGSRSAGGGALRAAAGGAAVDILRLRVLGGAVGDGGVLVTGGGLRLGDVLQVKTLNPKPFTVNPKPFTLHLSHLAARTLRLGDVLQVRSSHPIY